MHALHFRYSKEPGILFVNVSRHIKLYDELLFYFVDHVFEILKENNTYKKNSF